MREDQDSKKTSVRWFKNLFTWRSAGPKSGLLKRHVWRRGSPNKTTRDLVRGVLTTKKDSSLIAVLLSTQEQSFASDSGDTASGGGASASRDSGERGAIRTVQEYIDETPFWSDGTTVSSPPMTAMQWRIWTLATAGKFFEGLMVFMTGVALPLLLRSIGTEVLLYGLMGTSLLGAVVTWVFRIETTGVNLERIE